MPKDKAGNSLTWKEWLQRWKRGIEGITPLQQVNLQLKGTFIIIIGLCSGIVISIIGIKNLWWLLIILVGGLFNTVVQYLGLWQKKQVFKRLLPPKPTSFEKVENKVFATYYKLKRTIPLPKCKCGKEREFNKEICSSCQDEYTPTPFDNQNKEVIKNVKC